MSTYILVYDHIILINICKLLLTYHNVAGSSVMTSIQNILCSTRRFGQCYAVKLTDLIL